MLLLAAVLAWPNYLLTDGCAKGLELLHSGQADFPPIIMNAVPTLDSSILSVLGTDGRTLEHGDSVSIGEALKVDHNGMKGPLGFQTVFVVSSGHLSGGEPCGEGGASLVCRQVSPFSPTWHGPFTCQTPCFRIISHRHFVWTARVALSAGYAQPAGRRRDLATRRSRWDR